MYFYTFYLHKLCISYINFERDLKMKAFFNAPADPNEIIMFLKVIYPNMKLNESTSLIILDEIIHYIC